MSISLFVQSLFTKKKSITWFYGYAYSTGWVILILMLLIDIFTLPQIRRRRYFEVCLKKN